MSTVSAVPVVPVLMAHRSPSSLLKVSALVQLCGSTQANFFVDAKQARDLIGVLKESHQKIDPRLSEMARFGGGGGGGGRGRYGGGRGRGGMFTANRPSRSSSTNVYQGYSGGNAAPIRNSRW